jgi:hypothetical protein
MAKHKGRRNSVSEVYRAPHIGGPATTSQGEKFSTLLCPTSEGERLTEVWISSLRQDNGSQALTPLVSGGGMVATTEETAFARQEERDATPLAMSLQVAVYDQNPATRVVAIMELATYGRENPQVTGILSHLVYNDSDPLVQKAAAEALRLLE